MVGSFANPKVLEGFLDASWRTNKNDYSSTSGWVVRFGGEVVSWGSMKQKCIADFTGATKFIALILAGKEIEWLRNLLSEIPSGPN